MTNIFFSNTFSEFKIYILLYNCSLNFSIFNMYYLPVLNIHSNVLFLLVLFSKDTFNWSKMTVNTFIIVQKISISNKCCSFKLLIHRRIRFTQKHSAAQLFSTLIIIRNINWALNQHITDSRLILPTGRTFSVGCTNTLFGHIFLLYNIWLINAFWWTFIIVYSFIVTKLFNIQPVLFHQYYLWFKLCEQ